MLALGLAPIAAGDVPDYRNWVVEPAMPGSVQDLGSRFEPNRELLHHLAPDLVIATEGYGVDAAAMEAIAPVHVLSPFAPSGTSPIEHAAREAVRLGERLERRAAATELLARTEAVLTRSADTLRRQAARPVCIVTLFEERAARVYGGGLIADVLQRLGLVNAWTGASGTWGFARVGLEAFAALPADTRMVVLDPVPEPVRLRLEASALWANLPVVRAGNVSQIPPVWPFGGLAAAGRFAGSLAAVLTAPSGG